VRGLAAGALALLLGTGAPAAAATLYVTNTRGDSASVIDTETFEVLATIPLGPGKPNRIALHPDGRTAWVVYDRSHDLGVVDLQGRRLLRRVRIGGNPYNLAFSPDGRTLVVLDWASERSRDEAIFWDLQAGRVEGRVEVSTWPAHAVFAPDGRRLYVSGETAGDVTVIDVPARTVAGRVVHGGGDAMGLALSPDGRLLYAATGENRSLLKIDTAGLAAVGEIPLPGIVHDVVATPDGAFLYATLRKANRIAVVRVGEDRVVATIPQPGYPDLVLMDPSGRHAFVTNRRADVVTVVDVARHAQVRVIRVGRAPHGMALRPR
jgi:YVTN family beta-propeller protein